MTVEQLRTLHHANPFRPFTIYLADGSSVHVPHRDFLSHSASGRTIVVNHEDDTFSILDLLLITELKVENGQASRKRKPRRSA